MAREGGVGVPGSASAVRVRPRVPPLAAGGLRSRRVQGVLGVVVAVALLAFAAGFFSGRATKPGTSTGRPLGVWQPLPQAPLAGRLAEAAVWSGRELLVARRLRVT